MDKAAAPDWWSNYAAERALVQQKSTHKQKKNDKPRKLRHNFWCNPQNIHRTQKSLRAAHFCGILGLMDWREIEAELKALGVSLGEFYERARINRSTWQRFRAGKFELRADTARRVDAAMRVLRAERFGHSPRGGPDGDGDEPVDCAAVGRPC